MGISTGICLFRCRRAERNARIEDFLFRDSLATPFRYRQAVLEQRNRESLKTYWRALTNKLICRFIFMLRRYAKFSWMLISFNYLDGR